MVKLQTLVFITFLFVAITAVKETKKINLNTQEGQNEALMGVTLEVGQDFEIKVRENPTTGYIWRVPQANDAKLQLTENEYDNDPEDSNGNNAGIIGMGGIRTLKYHASIPGVSHIQMAESRVWGFDGFEGLTNDDYERDDVRSYFDIQVTIEEATITFMN